MGVLGVVLGGGHTGGGGGGDGENRQGSGAGLWSITGL